MNRSESFRDVISGAVPILGLIAGLIAGLAAAIFSSRATAQMRYPASSGDTAIPASSHRAALDLSPPNPSDLVREIDDPALGRRWLLYRDARHPQGPGRLVAATVIDRAGADPASSQGADFALRPVIRAGDRVVLEESTPVVEARLEAIALAPALPGATLKVRLVLGGKIVQAIAIAPGRVAFAPLSESQP